ncbi:MAG: HEAT repeat domain-containing protein [Candidatus Omnitrophica bacterium]|nr:HEAT repeat domain-containing protein [Candidatus Omnitrophota bacterium]
MPKYSLSILILAVVFMFTGMPYTSGDTIVTSDLVDAVIRCDLDGDGDVDVKDWLSFRAGYIARNPLYDLNGDNRVDRSDLLFFRSHFRQSAIELMQEWLGSDVVSERWNAIGKLGDIGTGWAIDMLLGHIADEEDSANRESITGIINNIGGETDREIALRLNDLFYSSSLTSWPKVDAVWMLSEIERPWIADLLLSLLSESPNYFVRKAVAESAGTLYNPDARYVPSLLDALQNDTERTVRREAAWSLYQIYDILPEAFEEVDINMLFELFQAEDDKDTRLSTIDLIGKIGNEQDYQVAQNINILLSTYNRSKLITAVNALGDLGDIRAIGPLMAFLQGEASLGLRDDVISAIGRVLGGATGDVSAVVDALVGIYEISGGIDDTTEYLYKSSIINALASLRSSRVVDIFIEWMKDSTRHLLSLQEFSYLDLIINSLGKMDSVYGIDALINCLGEDNEDFRMSAAKALGKIGPAAVGSLQRVLNTGNLQAKRHAAIALGDMQDIRAIDALVNTFGDADEGLSFILAPDALARIGASAQGALLRAANNENWRLRAGAAITMGRLRTPENIALLNGLLSDANIRVREAAKLALESNIGPSSRDVLLLLSYILDNDYLSSVSSEKELLRVLGSLEISGIRAALGIANLYSETARLRAYLRQKPQILARLFQGHNTTIDEIDKFTVGELRCLENFMDVWRLLGVNDELIMFRRQIVPHGTYSFGNSRAEITLKDAYYQVPMFLLDPLLHEFGHFLDHRRFRGDAMWTDPRAEDFANNFSAFMLDSREKFLEALRQTRGSPGSAYLEELLGILDIFSQGTNTSFLCQWTVNGIEKIPVEIGRDFAGSIYSIAGIPIENISALETFFSNLFTS